MSLKRGKQAERHFDVVIPAAGRGRRVEAFWPGEKALLSVAGRPLLLCILRELSALRPNRVVVVIRPDSAIPAAVSRWGELEVQYAIQPEPQGIADAVAIGARDSTGTVLVHLGDTYVPQRFLGTWLHEFKTNRYDGLLVLAEPPVPSETSVATVSAGHLDSIIERPRCSVPGQLGLTGSYFLSRGICDLIPALGMSKRGELEISELFELALRRGLDIGWTPSAWPWVDVGTWRGYRSARRLLSAEFEANGCRPALQHMVALHEG